MNQKTNLKGWNYIVYTLILNNFKDNPFLLSELYSFEPYFKAVYPKNLHIKDKLRQILQHLRDKGLLEFQYNGKYQLNNSIITNSNQKSTNQQEVVYLLSNESIPEWIKIGRTNEIDRRLKELYSTSVPLPFKVEETIRTNSLDESKILERSIHSIIDTINPSLRKKTEASKREFFKLSVDEGKSIFGLLSQIMGLNANDNRETTKH